MEQKETKGVPYFVNMVHDVGAGDYICLISACREFDRRTGNTVHTNYMKDVVEAYRDPNLRFGQEGAWMPLCVKDIHRIKDPKYYKNYYGTYLSAMGLLRGNDDPQLDLPTFEPMESYAIIQTKSNYARNTETSYVQELIDTFAQKTGMGVYAVGKADSPRDLKNVRYDLLKDGIINLMRIVQNARFVLIPRSCSAHLAAGYHKPAFVWIPEDGENWHLDYSNCPHVLHEWKEGAESAKVALEKFLEQQGMLKKE